MPAAAEPMLFRARERATARAAHFERTFDIKRTVLDGRHLQRSIASHDGFGSRGVRFARRLEGGGFVRMVAKGLVLGLPATAERGAKTGRVTRDVEIGEEDQR